MFFYAPKFFEVKAVKADLPCTSLVLQGYDSLNRLYKKLLVKEILELDWSTEKIDNYFDQNNLTR